MATLTQAQIVDVLWKNGFASAIRPDDIDSPAAKHVEIICAQGAAIVWAESRGNTEALGPPDGSGKRPAGLWQFKWWLRPGMTQADAFNPAIATKQAVKEARIQQAIMGGKPNWQPWSTWPLPALTYVPAMNALVRKEIMHEQSGGGSVDWGSTVGGTLGDVANAIGVPFAAFFNAISTIFTVGFWERAGIIILGAILLIFSLTWIMKEPLEGELKKMPPVIPV